MNKISWSLLVAIDGNHKGYGRDRHLACLRAWQPGIIEWLDEQIEIDRSTVMVILEAIMAADNDANMASLDTRCQVDEQGNILELPLRVSPYEWQGMDKDLEILEPLDLRRDGPFYADCDPWAEEEENNDPEIPEDTP